MGVCKKRVCNLPLRDRVTVMLKASVADGERAVRAGSLAGPSMDRSAKGAASTKHVVIVGAGFAGLNCARKLASDSSLRITLIDKNNYQQFPQQWRAFRLAHPALESSSKFYGASPCTGDRKIHYLTGVAYEDPDGVVGGERLTLEAGEYAVIHVNDTALLRDTWTWLLGHWLATSGRREKNAAEFERFTSISEAGTPIGPVEIWIPLEPLSRD
jgi:AraC family transcriptional regulator